MFEVGVPWRRRCLFLGEDAEVPDQPLGSLETINGNDLRHQHGGGDFANADNRVEVLVIRLTEALERLVELYEATDKTEEAAKWQAELDQRRAAEKARLAEEAALDKAKKAPKASAAEPTKPNDKR